MAEFQEDMLFKNVSDEDASILLEIMGKKSKKKLKFGQKN